MELKPEKDRKLKFHRYIECIAKGCSKIVNNQGFCWKHYIQKEKEEET